MPRPKSKWGEPRPPEDLATALPGSEHIGEKVEFREAIWNIVAVEQSDLTDIRTRMYVLERKNVVVQGRVSEDYRKGHRV